MHWMQFLVTTVYSNAKIWQQLVQKLRISYSLTTGIHFESLWEFISTLFFFFLFISAVQWPSSPSPEASFSAPCSAQGRTPWRLAMAVEVWAFGVVGRAGGAGAFLHKCQVSKGAKPFCSRRVLNSSLWRTRGLHWCLWSHRHPSICCLYTTGVVFSCNFSPCVSRASSWLTFWSACLLFLGSTLFLPNWYKMLFVDYFD